jgi:hypothetical protein
MFLIPCCDVYQYCFINQRLLNTMIGYNQTRFGHPATREYTHTEEYIQHNTSITVPSCNNHQQLMSVIIII